ncbi:hypothetical protein FE904_19845 [Chryseobacterium indologenes]|uniref:HD domain-containing protein n=1 Tax=Chryseobacterium indologenes TaxID=253 RepID=UPI001107DDE6|nr:hypothetical protein [Chryseobacterium indologenes]TLX23844.1 hypothetical protein FE904_19845 [Chryseobacterium indologenes]
MNVKNQFEQLCVSLTTDENLISTLWKEIEKKYTEKSRHYHVLTHLENMFLELESVQDKISDCTAVSFSVFYHDIVYDATSKSNEEKSAAVAKTRLARLGLHQDKISLISDQIIATKAHLKSEHTDTNYLLDADLSVLGKDLGTYLDYTQKIRKEYSIYPNILYNPGRKKVLRHFLELESIFKTDYFKEKYEMQARDNISHEIGLL